MPRDTDGNGPAHGSRAAEVDEARVEAEPEPLDCVELVELVTEYLEGAVDAPARRRIDRHLGECPGCAAYLDQMRRTIEAIGRLGAEDVPADAVEPLLAAFRAARRP